MEQGATTLDGVNFLMYAAYAAIYPVPQPNPGFGFIYTCVPKILPNGDWLKNIHAAGVRNPESAGRQKVDGGGAASAAQPPVPNQECHGKPGAAS